jgi:NAD(P)-dependent dehydrogenase (short-subunit alcohol dehydrogenase family)
MVVTPPKSLFITGASSGLGLALARHYLRQGARVGVVARRLEPLHSLASEFPQQVFCYALDVRDAAALQAAARDFLAQVGVPNIVIANAGVSVGTLTEYDEDLTAFQQVMDINVLGVVKTFQPFLVAMREAAKSKSPSIPLFQRGTQVGFANGKPEFKLVGIASVAGFRGLPGAGAYSASKAALISYLESLRVELHGSGVRVLTICPGYIETPMTAVNPYPMPFILPADEAASRIAGSIARNTSFAVVPWQMGAAGFLLRRLPRCLYDRLFARAPHKPRGG